MKQFHVIIVGGGLGGLTLAQGLKKNGISCAVYEKDLSRADRLQGYRIVFPPSSTSLIAATPRLRNRRIKNLSPRTFVPNYSRHIQRQTRRHGVTYDRKIVNTNGHEISSTQKLFHG
jgi:2-polyprenyl-6-methoxyphenol hydroxylase-like FAD-dependent oxidoreductase